MVNLLIADRIVLMYSPSGAGKTSLLRAAVIPDLIERGFRVRPIVRVNDDPLADRGTDHNRYLASVLHDLRGDSSDGPAPTSLRSFLDETTDGSVSGAPEVLIFDQFEEIVTLDATDVGAKTEFFEQVGAVLRDPNRRALFAMREEFVAALDDYREAIPRSLDVSYRLDLLDRDQAADAIVGPAGERGVEFDRDAALLLADQLRTVNVQLADGSVVPRKGPTVEPVQLQVVCERLWTAGRTDPAAITVADIDALGDEAASLVDDSLRRYYADKIALVAERADVPERELRRWFSERLISEHGVRLSVLWQPDETGGLAAAAVDELDDARLIRREVAGGRPFVELSHDRLVRPIREDNDAWATQHLVRLQQLAPMWAREKPESLLLQGADLAQAESWIATSGVELTETEGEFLEASRELAIREHERRRRERLIRRLFVGALALAVVAGVLAVTAFLAFRSAREQERRATSRQLAALASDGATQGDVGLVLAREAYEFEPTVEATGALLTVLERHPTVTRYLHGHTDRVVSIDVSADGRWLASGSDDTTIRLVDLVNDTTTVLSGHERSVVAVAFNADSTLLASSDDSGRVRLWDVDTGSPTVDPWQGHDARIRALAFHPVDPTVLATGSQDGSIVVWDVGANPPVARQAIEMAHRLGNEPREVRDIDFDPSGRFIASGGDDFQVRLWDWERGEQIGAPGADHTDLVRSVSFSTAPGVRIVASGGNDRTAIVWSWDPEDGLQRAAGIGGRELAQLEGHSERIYDIEFAPDSLLLATASRDRTMRLWDAARGAEWQFDDDVVADEFDAHAGAIRAIAFLPTAAGGQPVLATASNDRTVALSEPLRRHRLGTRLEVGRDDLWAIERHPTASTFVTAVDGGDLQIWDPVAGLPVGEPLEGHVGTIRSIRFRGDGGALASSGDDCTIRIWSYPDGAPVSTLSGHTRSVIGLAFSPSGRQLVSVAQDGMVAAWDLASGAMRQLTTISDDETDLGDCTDGPVAEFDGTNTRRLPAGVRFTEDGRWLIVSANDGSYRVWDWADDRDGEMTVLTPSEVIAMPDLVGGTDIAFSPSADEVLLWDLPADWTPLGNPGSEILRLATPVVSAVTAGPDDTIVTTSGDGSFRLWDVASGRPLGNAVPTGAPVSAAVGFPDERRLVTVGRSGSLVVWNLDVEEWAASVCPLVGRSLTPAEWQVFVPDESYRSTCGVR